ncbi:molybdopterin guanine dinucleotide-containing S/N-oxide reductase [Bradyrhizobium neotropicale]|uniref:molybdopterin guanine dinucleotide-containing S/N-oxide reductase n=1 Tax=Bradyrhizobium neotropicale TaxID=1497615 RepID=UPI001AD7A507|nr:molybdopterin guanine dinucleotide-containing S/N-oxide reductase [Bradyrhizobium neotropicale]MBO4221054.1 molybdopterin-dependent oxidoreductase [Bradyrhizobium neotropicale]
MTHSNATDRDGAFATHSAHWGAFSARWDGQDISILPYGGDPAPSPILGNFKGALRHKARILKPMVRRNWLEHGPGPQRREIGDDFVKCGWDTALDLLAGELARVRDNFSPRAIYGGSYGWASAGRFHHAQSQIHRFLNLVCGGYVRSVNSYSAGASAVILPHVMGPFEALSRRNVTWDQLRTHTEIVLAFGGMPIKNSMVASGGLSRHVEPDAMRAAVERGTRFISISPLRDDFPAEAKAEWIPIRPGTDVAVMLAMAHTLLVENLCDRAFVDRYTTGFEVFESYLRGDSDGQPKHADWAAAISGIAADTIRDIARSLVRNRSLIAVAHALQRAQYGEQPVWAAAALAAMVGQIGLPGGGYNYALGAMGHTGRRVNAVPIPTMPQGSNPVREFIPVARISDMLLNPGAPFAYNGSELRYPDIKLVYWAGGNPFHHHQDIHRLRQAFARPDTIVVHELAWTAMARSADIVLPATMTLERDDIGAAATDPRLIAMRKVAPAIGQARDDFAILCELAERLGAAKVFAEGRDAAQWMRHLYEPTRRALAERGWEAPDFDEFWDRGELALPSEPDDGGILRRFRTTPKESPLPTPSGKIEMFSKTIAGYGYEDCPGHPTWLASTEQPDTAAPLWLVANQPATRLHGQLDFGGYSQSRKIEGREVARMHPDDAAPRGIVDGDVIRIFNARGACLAAVKVTDDVMRGVVNLPTGAWYDPAPDGAENPLCLHGNPNVLTRDVGTSRLAQGCCGQITVVDCEKFVGTAPAVRAYEPPIPVKSRSR